MEFSEGVGQYVVIRVKKSYVLPFSNAETCVASTSESQIFLMDHPYPRVHCRVRIAHIRTIVWAAIIYKNHFYV